MLSLVVTLLIIALIAAVLGFGGIAGAAVGIAKIVFFVALVLFLISLSRERHARRLWPAPLASIALNSFALTVRCRTFRRRFRFG